MACRRPPLTSRRCVSPRAVKPARECATQGALASMLGLLLFRRRQSRVPGEGDDKRIAAPDSARTQHTLPRPSEPALLLAISLSGLE